MIKYEDIDLEKSSLKSFYQEMNNHNNNNDDDNVSLFSVNFSEISEIKNMKWN